MSGAFLSIEVQGLEPALAWLNRLASPSLRRTGMVMLGGLIESQTRRRISNEKRAPDGQPWKPWSASYLKSRRKGHSLLQAGGGLLDSLAWHEVGEDIEIGSNLVYAAIHQAGGLPEMRPGPAAIPARPYLGLSEENVAEANEALLEWIGETLH